MSFSSSKSIATAIAATIANNFQKDNRCIRLDAAVFLYQLFLIKIDESAHGNKSDDGQNQLNRHI